LGGSLITDKNLPHTPRIDVLARLAKEIVAGLRIQKEKSAGEEPQRPYLMIGHGSGSFGHVPARQHGTRQGVRTHQEWLGFVEVWREAAALNHLVVDALQAAGLPAISFPPSAAVVAQDGKLFSWDLTPIRQALEAGLLPVVYGDVVFDRQRGGTILSTEDLFSYLAHQLTPKRLLLAGLEAGVWADFPICNQLIPEITPQNLPQISGALSGSLATDVTGGMASKVQEMVSLVRVVPRLEVLIFSGQTPGVLTQVVGQDASIGTLIHNPEP
jgi:isopentenyl phosphate kinase